MALREQIGGLTSGAATGAALGSIIPGIGTALGAGIGAGAGLLGGLFGPKEDTDAIERQKIGERNKLLNEQTRPQLQLGGDLTQYTGNKHSEGGIPRGAVEVEDGETEFGGYVFSDYLSPNAKNRSFADISKDIDGKYFRENDPFSKASKDMEFKNLMQSQEGLRSEISESGMIQPDNLKFGGKAEKVKMGENKYQLGGFTSEDPFAIFQAVGGKQVDPDAGMDRGMLLDRDKMAYGGLIDDPSKTLSFINENNGQALPQAQIIRGLDSAFDLNGAVNPANDFSDVANINPFGDPTAFNQAASSPVSALTQPAGQVGFTDPGQALAQPSMLAGDVANQAVGAGLSGGNTGINPLAAALPGAIAGVGNLFLSTQTDYPIQQVRAGTTDARLLDPTRALQETRSAFSGANSALNAQGAGMTNRIGLAAAEAQARAGVFADFEQRNVGIQNQTDQVNAQRRQQADSINAQQAVNQKTRTIEDRNAGIAGGIQAFSGAASDYAREYSQQLRTKQQLPLLGTSNVNTQFTDGQLQQVLQALQGDQQYTNILAGK